LALAISRKLNITTEVAHDRNNQFMLTISRTQLPTVRDSIKSYMHPSVYYKLGCTAEQSPVL